LVRNSNGGKKDYPTKRIFSVKIWRTIGKFFQQQASTNTTMASMTQETAAGMTALKPSSRKQRRDFIKGVQPVTTDPNDLIQSDNEEEEAEVPRKMDAKLGQKHAYGNPPSLPSTIKVGKSSDSQLTSSVPGLSSLVDMSMTEISEENQISMIKTCIKNTCSLFQ
jgi:hypothetical protein